ncbi:hypothetical protein [Arthrobacter sp. N1]|uniref:hypothetical protein n=1 Tax=Arthrobacter sp. N1 TaxID=619291 RepID=UPI003BAFA5CB
MSQHQHQFHPNFGYAAAPPPRPTFFGLGITAGILGILSSLLLAPVAISLLAYAQSGIKYGGGAPYDGAGVIGGALMVIAVLMFVLSILAIVLNRKRGVKLLTSLLATAVISVALTAISGAIGYTGVQFAFVTAVFMLPLIILSPLAILAARKAAKEPALHR